MHIKKQQLELDMEQQTVSKLGKEYIKAAYLTYMQVHHANARLDEAQARIKISGRNLRYADDTILMAESEELKVMKVKVESEKLA